VKNGMPISLYKMELYPALTESQDPHLKIPSIRKEKVGDQLPVKARLVRFSETCSTVFQRRSRTGLTISGDEGNPLIEVSLYFAQSFGWVFYMKESDYNIKWYMLSLCV
jgi:hypothetical protein